VDETGASFFLMQAIRSSTPEIEAMRSVIALLTSKPLYFADLECLAGIGERFPEIGPEVAAVLASP
jgi:hypothetical protein